MKKDDKGQQRSTQQHDSLDYSLDRLRDLYINFKELASRCMIEIGAKDKTDKRVFYFKPESFLLEDPEKQRQYRDKIMKKITALPNPEPIHYMGDDLHKQIMEAIQDKADPTVCKKQLANFYKRRQFYFQHKKYKLLLRWAHHAIASENLDRVGIEATQKYAKWEMDMENAIKRFERLDFEDGYDQAKNKTFKRPQTKAKEGGSLYVENIDLEPMSVIRADDIETYLRTVTYDQKINRLMTKFLARLKWLPLYRRFEIFQDAVESYFKIKEVNVKNQEKLLEKIHAKGTAIIPHDHEEQLDEFKRIMGSYYIQDYQSKLEARQDKILASHKADHQLAPTMISNVLELKVQIVDKAIEYGIYGDIELDQGYSFAYQITIFFPSYFQKQIIQSQFSLYDAFAGEESDMNTVQKRNLLNMVKIDTNIFKDISTTPHNVPSQEFLNTDPSFQNIKVTRLKSSSYWIDYVCVFPKIPIHIQKQAAYLATDNPIDSLLRSALNFLDVNDLATVNKILEETARLHQQQQKELSAQEKIQKGTAGNKEEKDGKGNMNSVALNLRVHFQSAIKGEMGTKESLAKSSTNITNQSLKYLPQHLINAYYNLRHIKTRDYKIKLLYCLNYFRAIQKRMALDLKEFGTRERIYGDQVQPYNAPTEASRQAQINVNTQFTKTLMEQQKLNNISEKLNKSQMGDTTSHMGETLANLSVASAGGDRQASLLKQAEMSEQKEKTFNTIPEGEGDGDGASSSTKLYDMKQFKYKGKFCNKIYSTCPVLPRFHATFGEPVEFQPLNVEMERQGGQQHISDEGARLLGRVDHFELSKETREVWVKDDFGIYIIQECAMQDMRDLEEELLKIGSFYIAKHEHLVNTECERAYPHVDRITLLEDLLDKELDFQFEKVQLVQSYMETYEHISDPLEQQRLIQVIVDLMSLRPRLNLQATYFSDSYDVERLTLRKHTEVMKTMILNQMRGEKLENRKMQAFVDLSMRITQEHQKGQWKYADAEEFFKELKRRRQASSAMNGGAVGQSGQDYIRAGGPSNLSMPNKPDRQQLEKVQDNRQGQASELSATQKFMQTQVEKQHASKYNHMDQGSMPQQDQNAATNEDKKSAHKDHEGGFAAVLGLPQITVETLYQQYKEKDEVILELMNEQANYVKLYEGYPDGMLEMQGLQSHKLSNYKFADWSQPINVLDFYESLGFASKFYATIQSIVTEIQEVHKPHNYSMLAMMELKVLERSEVEYQKVKAFFDGDLLEYKGQQYVEDEAIVGNSEKIVFHIQDMVSNLNKATKETINPFIIGKLDIDTVAHFDFASLPKDQNKYLFKNDGPLQVAQDFDLQVKLAEQNAKAASQAQSRYFSQLKEFMRKINAPPMLHLYCNSVELLRLRQELITTMSETMVLTEIYEGQGKLVNRPNFRPFFADQVKFDNYLIDTTKVNYIDDGPAAGFEFDLAIKEFDQVLKSNVNFRNPDAVKMLLCTSGLEELRGILHYQLMHKQLLIIAVRYNQVMLDTHQRALCELELARKNLSLPNTVVRIQNLFCKTGDGFSTEQLVKEKAKYMNNLSNNAANNFYQITGKKAKSRNTISKRFSMQLQTVAAQHRKVESCLRIMRAYKVRLLHIYCQEVMRDAYFDCLKIQAVTTCQRLRQMSQVFTIDESVVGMMNYPHNRQEAQVFKYEHHEFFENFFSHYNPEYLDDQSKVPFGGPPGQQQNLPKAINPVKMEILDYAIIPSTMTLMKLDALSHEESQTLTDSLPNLLEPQTQSQKDGQINLQPNSKDEGENPNDEQEKFIKEVLPQIDFNEPEYPQFQDKDRTNLRLNDFKQSFDYSHTQFGQLFTYYAMLERIMKFELSLNKMKGNLIDALNLEEAIQTGQPFWGIDPEAAIHKKRQQEAIYGNIPKMSEKILEKLVSEKRTKVNLAEDVANLSNTLYQIVTRCQTLSDNATKVPTHYHPLARVIEYLITHSEFRFYYIIHSIERLLDTYYLKGSAKEVKFLTDLYNGLTKKDHIKVTYNYNAFHVNGAYTRPEHYGLDACNYFGYYGNQEEEISFFSCVQPCINEKALAPPQISLFEGIYGSQRPRPLQFAGQIPPAVYPALDTAFINFSDQERRYITSTIHSVKVLVVDFLDNIHKEKVAQEQFEEVATLDQVRKCNKFLSDLIKARQLKVALMQWIAGSSLPLDPEVYNQVFQQYKNDIFWKIMNKKDSLPPIGGAGKDDGKSLQESPNKKAENSMQQNQQLTLMQAQVLVEQVQTSKAEIYVLQNELQRNIVNSAIQVIESESAALANCFNLTATPIASHIHPFQQFASTLYSRVDPNSHLDIVTKLSEVQRFITKLNNRGTEVETLTSGPGMVFTIKDFNECVQILCRGLIKYSEREMRSRSEQFAKKEAHYVNLLYVKDRQIENLQARITQTQENLDKLINSKMYEKGNALIYELDNVNRQLRLFKDHVYMMEKEVKTNVKQEFQEFLRKQRDNLETAVDKFKEYKSSITHRVNQDVAAQQQAIENAIKQKAEQYKNQEFGQEDWIQYKKAAGMMAQGGAAGANNTNKLNSLSGPPVVDKNKKHIGGYYDEIANMTEIEARQELAEMWTEMRKLHVFWKTKEILTKDKYEREIFVLKKQLTSNACLWEQLAESDKREKVLKQELLYTQQSLAASEKVIDKLKEDLRKSESDRIRLNQYKTSKAQRLEELEGKVRKFEVMDNINLEKLIDALGNKEKQIQRLREIERSFNDRVDQVERKKEGEIRDVKNSYFKELGMKKEVMERLEGLRMELRLLEKNEGSMTEVWKSKCKELVDICNKLKTENETLRTKIQQIAMNLSSYGGVGGQVLDNESNYQQQTSYRQYEQQQPFTNNNGGSVQLPKLMNNGQNRLVQNIQGGKFGAQNNVGGGGISHTRQSSIAKALDSNPLMSPALGMIYDHSTAPGSRQKEPSSAQKSQRFPKEANSFGKQSFGLAISNAQSANKNQTFGVLGQPAQMNKGYQSLKVTMVANTPKDPENV